MRDLLLVGLGHAHRHLLMRLPELGDAFRVTVVAPHDGRYGGANAAMLAGSLSSDRLRWSPPANVRVITSRAVGCQPIHRRLWLADGRAIHYDRLSLNMGTRRLPVWAMRPRIGQPRTWSGHSVMQLIGLRAALAADERASVVIAGGSRQALEIAGGLAAPAAPSRVGVVTLLWPNRSDGRRIRAALRRLAWWGVDVVAMADAAALGEGCLRCIDGRRFAADHVIYAGPAEPDPLALAMTLPAHGPGLRVDRRLTSPRASSVRILGGTASLDGRCALAGWDGDRQARVVLSGLRAETGAHALERYAPPLRAMPIDLGGRAGSVSGASLLGWWARLRRRRAQRRWLDKPRA